MDYGIMILLETPHGLYIFSFVRIPRWTTPLDLLQGDLTRFNSETLCEYS